MPADQTGYLEQKRRCLKIAVYMKILCTVLHEAHRRQVEETMGTLAEGPEDFYKIYLH